jgi:peptidylprolyl isomerase
LGRITFKLYNDTPKTSENFRCLCTGEKGKHLHYKNTPFHRIIPHYMICGGDITNQDGTGGESIYGKHFADENFKHLHDKPYVLAMSNLGEPNTNSSQFYITTNKAQWMDEENVVFGEVFKGQHVVDDIKELGEENTG